MKRILVVLDGSAFSRAAQDYACHLAKAEQAQLTGIAIIDLPGIERSIGPVPLGATEIILSYAVRSKADLLVIGTHGRENIRSFFFGSVTKRIVEEAHLPLFIYH